MEGDCRGGGGGDCGEGGWNINPKVVPGYQEGGITG